MKKLIIKTIIQFVGATIVCAVLFSMPILATCSFVFTWPPLICCLSLFVSACEFVLLTVGLYFIYFIEEGDE